MSRLIAIVNYQLNGNRNFDRLFITIDHPRTNLIYHNSKTNLHRISLNQYSRQNVYHHYHHQKKKERYYQRFARINRKNKLLRHNYLLTLCGPPKNLATFMENPQDPRTADSLNHKSLSSINHLLIPRISPVAGSHSSALTSSFSCWPLAKIAIHHRIN